VRAINKYATFRVASPPKVTAETEATYRRVVAALEDCEYCDDDLDVPASQLYITY
jgi:hypothetical protein